MSKPLWFRLWSEAKNDAKLDALSDAEFRCWFKLLCAASEGEERGSVEIDDPELLAIELRVEAPVLEAAIGRMKRLHLLVEDGDTLIFPSFESRQYLKPSDKPEKTRERKAKQRDREHVTPVSRQSHAPTEQNRTDRDTEQRRSAREDPPPQPRSNDFPECMSGEWSVGDGPTLTGFAHITRAAERKAARPLSPSDLGLMAAALKSRCNGCKGADNDVCATALIDRIKRRGIASGCKYYIADYGGES